MFKVRANFFYLGVVVKLIRQDRCINRIGVFAVTLPACPHFLPTEQLQSAHKQFIFCCCRDQIFSLPCINGNKTIKQQLNLIMSNNENTSSLSDFQRGAEPLVSLFRKATLTQKSSQMQRVGLCLNTKPMQALPGTEGKDRLFSILDEALKLVEDVDGNDELLVRSSRPERTASLQNAMVARGA